MKGLHATAGVLVIVREALHLRGTQPPTVEVHHALSEIIT